MLRIYNNWNKIFELVESNFNNCDSAIHNQTHWKSVALNGLEICKRDPLVQNNIVFLFAVFHDCMRIDDRFEMEHGRKASVFIDKNKHKLQFLNYEEIEKLSFACRHHTDGKTSEDPTIGACWDSDRLDLWRANIVPDNKYLSTKASKTKEVKEKSKTHFLTKLDWLEIIDLYIKI